MNFNVGVKHNAFLDDSDDSDLDSNNSTAKRKLFDEMIFDQSSLNNGDSSFQYNYSSKQKKPLIIKRKKTSLHSLKTVSELPDAFRDVFDFKCFNRMQSESFNQVYGCTSNNCVISAPTGSGKTVLFELAILNVLRTTTDFQNLKIVYIAPTKSLCMEKYNQWKLKFKKLSVGFLTSDTSVLEVEELENANIVITTPEKWDLLTRKWLDFKRLFDMVKLCLIDEIHTLKDSRGAVLETVITRMNILCVDLTIIAVSATIPNIDDVGAWLKNKKTGSPATVLKYDDSYRQVQIQKHVFGYNLNSRNDYHSEITYNAQLEKILETYSLNKPVLIFCPTRNSTSTTAKYLMNNYKLSKTNNRIVENISDAQLKECCLSGIAYHHAGLNYGDRKLIEVLFLDGHIKFLCSTSTLAMGVNLPAYLVIIKGTKIWSQTGYKEYSQLDILQMIGRAGRPQFEKSGCAVIMTSSSQTSQYEQLITGSCPLESMLHLQLSENICAEIGIGSINSIESAVKWLKDTFFYIRVMKNPSNYKVQGFSRNISDENLYKLCETIISRLTESKVVTVDYNNKLECTEYGTALSRHYVSLETIDTFIKCKAACSISKILELLSQAKEFNDMRIKHNEKTFFRDLNQHPGIKFPFKINGKVNPLIHETCMKVSLILQMELGGVDVFGSKGFKTLLSTVIQDKQLIFRQSPRIIKCMIDCFIQKKDGISLENTMFVLRSINGQGWDDSSMVFKQIKDIGLASVQKFAKHGIDTIEQLKKFNSSNVEYYLGLSRGGGVKFTDHIKTIPELQMETSNSVKKPKNSPAVVDFKVKIKAIFSSELWHEKKLYVDIFCIKSDGKLIDFRRISIVKLKDWKYFGVRAEIQNSDEIFKFVICCEDIAGVSKALKIRPSVPLSLNYLLNHNLDLDDDLDIVNHFQQKSVTKPQTKPVNNNAVKLREPLENGNYECLHSCKNKEACRHLCCRDGIPIRSLPNSVVEENFKEIATQPETEVFVIDSSRDSSVACDSHVNCGKYAHPTNLSMFEHTSVSDFSVTLYEAKKETLENCGFKKDTALLKNSKSYSSSAGLEVIPSSGQSLLEYSKQLDFLGSDVEFE